jgi:hypothetical protein
MEASPDQAKAEKKTPAASSPSKVEAKTPVPGEKEAPAPYKEKVELEFQPPADLLQILQIDKHLESLPEVEATEIIPIEDKPIITVFLRKPMSLIDTLSKLPEVSEIKEDTEFEGTDEASPTKAKSKKFQITLSGSTEK